MYFSAELRYKSDPVLVQTIRTNSDKKKKLWFRAAEESKEIRGLTILDKELFVVSEESSEVEVYDSMEFSFSRRWNLKELIDPMDIGSCNRNKCLYIFDSKDIDQSNEILRVDPNGKLIKNWSTGDDYGWGLSVTDESNVILTVYNKNKLNEYSPDGQLIREINLSSDAGIRHPLHAIKLTNGHFVVSHGDYSDDLHRVCIVDADGKLMKSFGGKRGSTIGQMNRPFYLSVDGNGFVMVADQGNSRVLLLDSDLKFKREILSKEKHGLRHPWRILLDESNGRLFVADNESNNQRILVFDCNN